MGVGGVPAEFGRAVLWLRLASERVSSVGAVGLDIQILGPLRVLCDGVEVGLGGTRRKALLALLILQRDEVVAADRIAEAIWDGHPPGGAMGTVQSHVSHLRRALGAAARAIVTQPPGYVLRIAADGIDAGRFEALAAEGRALAMAEDHSSALARYDDALALWRGRPLVDLAGVEFVEREASRLEELRLSAMELRVDSLLALGRHEPVVASLGALVDEHPLRERLVAQLMLALYRCGRQADALRVYERARVGLRDELGVEPSAALRDLHLAILRHESHLVGPRPRESGDRDRALAMDRTLAPRAAVAGNLRRPATAWFGSDVMVNRLASDLSRNRVVTFTGTGGIGKSRLAAEVGSRMSRKFAHGVWMVDLAPIVDAEAVVMAVDATLALQPQADMGPDQALVDWLRDRHLLLILDNCEHMLDAVRSVVTAIAAGCPRVTTLITSRAPLDVAAERVIPVPMLSMHDAVGLFCDRAAAVGGPVEFSEADRAVIVSICERLDGIPLAVELAAGRARALAVGEILQRLDDRFRLLTRGRRGDIGHHQTLRATVDWSYQLLSDLERMLFERLSVFPAGFDLAAAEVVCSGGVLAEADVVDVLDSLVAKSMVVVDGGRYRLLETLRHYAAEHCREHENGSALNARHLDHYRAVAWHAHETCASSQQARGDHVFGLEWDNLRAAHGWAVATAKAAFAHDVVELTGDHAFRRYRHEHAAWATQNLVLGTEGSSSASFGWAALWAFLGGRVDEARDLAHRGIREASRPDDAHSAQCWVALASVQLASGDSTGARGSAANAVAAAMTGGDAFSLAWALSAVIEAALSTDPGSVAHWVSELRALAHDAGAPSLLARSAYYGGHQHMNATDADARTARDDYAEGFALAQSVGDVFMEQMNFYGVVDATTVLRAADSARVGHDALTHFYESRNWIGIFGLLDSLSEWLAFEGHAEVASIIYGHLEAHHHSAWDSPLVRQRRVIGLDAVRTHDDAERWMARGSVMDRDRVVTFTIARLAELIPTGD
jgi:predicted ATPase/DNA-binding SARP family transcriptional activator